MPSSGDSGPVETEEVAAGGRTGLLNFSGTKRSGSPGGSGAWRLTHGQWTPGLQTRYDANHPIPARRGSSSGITTIHRYIWEGILPWPGVILWQMLPSRW